MEISQIFMGVLDVLVHLIADIKLSIEDFDFSMCRMKCKSLSGFDLMIRSENSSYSFDSVISCCLF